MKSWTITGEDRHADCSKALRIYRVLLASAEGGISRLKDWQIAKLSGVNPSKVNTTLKEMQDAGLLTRDTRVVSPPPGHEGPYMARTIQLHFDAIRELTNTALWRARPGMSA